jgi:two-component system response regulator NreC
VTRILIVDDHAVVRSGLRLLLSAQDDLEVVGEAGNARDAIFEARSTKPDVILLDVVMPGESGIDVLPRLKDEAPNAKVLVLSMQDDPLYVREAFARGASGYVLKEAADSEVVSAVREIASGGSYVHPALGARMVAADAEARAAEASDPLSEREREVMRLLALGHTNQEIAKQLFISVRTAETHRAHIMRKLGLTTRAELGRHALAHGLHADAEPLRVRQSRDGDSAGLWGDRATPGLSVLRRAARPPLAPLRARDGPRRRPAHLCERAAARAADARRTGCARVRRLRHHRSRAGRAALRQRHGARDRRRADHDEPRRAHGGERRRLAHGHGVRDRR